MGSPEKVEIILASDAAEIGRMAMPEEVKKQYAYAVKPRLLEGAVGTGQLVIEQLADESHEAIPID